MLLPLGPIRQAALSSRYTTDWDELAELLTDSYCIQAPPALAEQVPRPSPDQDPSGPRGSDSEEQMQRE